MSRRALRSWLAWHRSTALVLGASVLLYALTGWLFALPELGARKWRDEHRELPLSDPARFQDDPAHELPALLETLGVRARLDEVKRTPAGVEVLARRPGLRVELEAAKGAEEAQVRVRRAGLARAAPALHGTIHYRGGLAFWLWAAVADLTALALVLFGVSGVALAWRRDRRATLWLVGPTALLTVVTVIALARAP